MTKRNAKFCLKDRLIEKSIEAYVLSLETINRLSVQYRLETFSFLLCNAWELLLKAKVIHDSGDDESIYYRGKEGDKRRSLSLRDCLKRTLPKSKDPLRRNIERIEELRNESVHLVISRIPVDVARLFQAGVINYHEKLRNWFGESLADRYPVGMMTIEYDRAPWQSDFGKSGLQEELGPDAASFLLAFCLELQQESEQLGRTPQFTIPLDYRLAFTKRHDEADIIVAYGSDGSDSVLPLHVPQDPGTTHPYRQKEVIEEVNQNLGVTINQYDIQSINKVHNVKSNNNYYFQGIVSGSPNQYSQSFVDWIISRYRHDKDFFDKTRLKRRDMDLKR